MTDTQSTPEIPNPYRWYAARDPESEFWGGHVATREEIIDYGRASFPGESFEITESNKAMPSFDIFDAAEIYDRINEQECWDEDGFDGFGDQGPSLENALRDAFRKWWTENGIGTGWTFGDQRVNERIEPLTGVSANG